MVPVLDDHGQGAADGQPSPHPADQPGLVGLDLLPLPAPVPPLPPGQVVPRPGRIEIRIGKPMMFGGNGVDLAREAPGRARRMIADEVVAAIQKLSGQEYVPMYASVRKDEQSAQTAARRQH